MATVDERLAALEARFAQIDARQALADARELERERTRREGFEFLRTGRVTPVEPVEPIDEPRGR